MSTSKESSISRELLKYPYSGRRNESTNFLSEQICYYTLRTRKKITKKAKKIVIFVEVIIRVTSGIPPSHAIGLPSSPATVTVRTAHHFNSSSLKKEVIAQVINEIPAKISFTNLEINKLYDLSVDFENNSINKEQLIDSLTKLRGGDFVDIKVALGIIGAIIIVLMNAQSSAFQPNQNAIIPPHLQWIYDNMQPGNTFGHRKDAGAKSLTINKSTQNVGSENEDRSSGSYNYNDVMKELDKQSHKTKINIQAGGQMYTIKNPERQDAKELQYVLAEKMYDSIRESDKDVSSIASNTRFKAYNINKVKDHVFYNEHDLDRYGQNAIEHKRFDPTLVQALSWKRLEVGTYTEDDLTWIKHECAERHHEFKYNSGYSEAHDRAQSRYDGYPWEDKF